MDVFSVVFFIIIIIIIMIMNRQPSTIPNHKTALVKHESSTSRFSSLSSLYSFLMFPYHHRSCLAIAPGFGATPFEGRRPGDPVATPGAEQDGGSLVTRSEAAEVNGPCSQICSSGTAVDSWLVYQRVQKFLVVVSCGPMPVCDSNTMFRCSVSLSV